MNDLDSFNYSFITNVIKDYFEYIDESFFHTSYRKHFCESNGFYERTILTLFGEIRFKRRYYYDKKYHDRFYFTDLFLLSVLKFVMNLLLSLTLKLVRLFLIKLVKKLIITYLYLVPLLEI